jgi:hypothetical protein
MINIDKFNELTARIFSDLYETFPVTQVIISHRLVGISDAEYEDLYFAAATGDEIKCAKRNEDQFAKATIIWLCQFDYLAGDYNPGHLPSELTLTPKTLALLNQVPASLDNAKTFGDSIIDAVKQGSLDTASDLVKKCLLGAINIVSG